jgi:uncharacterized membrane protein
MNTVTALKFDSPEGAEKALAVIRSLQKEHLITLHDAAIVTWPVGKKKPKTRQLLDLPSAGALSGMFWGSLFGMIFAVPLFGIAMGSVLGTLGGAMRDYGIDDDFIGWIRKQVTEGTSALFLMTSDAVQDRVIERVKDLKFEIIATNLSKAQKQKLLEAFGQEQ